MLPEGLLSFPLTPFTPDDQIAADVLAEHVDDQIVQGVGAVFVACGTGEFTSLTPEEYRTVVRTAVRTSAGRVPVFAGAGGGAGLARRFVEEATAADADGALLLPPYLVTGPQDGLLAHVRYAIAGSGLPTIVYQRANAAFAPETVTALLDDPTVIGLKDGIGDVDALLQIITTVRTSGHPRAGEFSFFNGMPTAELSAPALRGLGVRSYSSAVHCFAPDIARAFYDALAADDEPIVTRLLTDFYLPFARLRSQRPGYAVSLVKAGARLAGHQVGGVRPPLVDPNAEHVTELAELLGTARAALRETTT